MILKKQIVKLARGAKGASRVLANATTSQKNRALLRMAAALVHQGKSLLPSGIKRLEGKFQAGEVASIVDESGVEFARGLTNYGSEEIERIQGDRSDRIEAILGYKTYDEIIHRDNMVVL